MKNTLGLVKDSLLCTIICVSLIIFNATAMLTSVITTMVIIVLMGCYFQNKPIIRPILSGIVIVLVSFLFMNPINVLIFVLPAAILGILSSVFLRNVKNIKIFYLVFTITFFIINVVSELAIAKYIMNMDFITYIMSDNIIEVPENLASKTTLFLICYLGILAVISILQVVILHKSNKIYKKRVMKLIGEKESETIN